MDDQGGGTTVEYRGGTAVGLFGFFLSTDITVPNLRVGRTATAITTGFANNSIIGVRTRWQDSTDTPGATSVVVPVADYISLATLKTEVAASADFAAFKTRIAAL